MSGMSPLVLAALGLGIFFCVSGAAILWQPAGAARAATAFPRHGPSGKILAAIALLWVALIIYHASLGRFEYLKFLPARIIPPLAPLMEGPLGFLFQTPLWAALGSWALITRTMDDLLAPRALGGVLLLIANPLLNAARWHPSTWRLVVTVIAYIMVIQGIWLILSPFRFRMTAQWLLASPQRTRYAGLAAAATGLLLLVLGLGVY